MSRNQATLKEGICSNREIIGVLYFLFLFNDKKPYFSFGQNETVPDLNFIDFKNDMICRFFDDKSDEIQLFRMNLNMDYADDFNYYKLNMDLDDFANEVNQFQLEGFFSRIHFKPDSEDKKDAVRRFQEFKHEFRGLYASKNLGLV